MSKKGHLELEERVERGAGRKDEVVKAR